MDLIKDKGWREQLGSEFKKTYMIDLLKFIKEEKSAGKNIFPATHQIFKAFDLTPFDEVKVVILGQDPYHGLGQAHGLCFSVPKGIKVPPSLVNIYKELKNDLHLGIPDHGNLEIWARQGVLLLNAVLTVEEGKAASHHNKGWEEFTDKVIEVLNQEKDHLVFILWGAPAQKKARHLDSTKHLILKSPHPSPLSSYRGFFGSRPFSKTNAYLRKHQLTEINWQIES